MDNAELLAIQPTEYLKNGFYDKDGEALEGVNGFYSLAMAYRLREEQMNPDELKKIVDRLMEIVPRHDRAVEDNPQLPLDADSRAALEEVTKKSASPTLTAIFDAGRPWVKDWRTYAALTLHLQRILSQLALLRSLSEKE